MYGLEAVKENRKMSVVITKRVGGGFTIVKDGGTPKQESNLWYKSNNIGISLQNPNGGTEVLPTAPAQWTVGVDTGFTTNEQVADKLDVLGVSLAGKVDVVIQDSSSPLVVAKMSNVLENTTTTALLAIDDYVVSVTSATGFVVGQLMTIFNVAENRVFLAQILSINVLDITIDSPLDFAFPAGSFVTVGNTNMNVNGSVTPQIFGVRNPSGQDIPQTVDITRIIITFLTNTTVDLSKFGDILDGITRGIVLRRIDGTNQNIFNAKTNAELKNLMLDVDIETVLGNQQNGLTGRFTFAGQDKLGAVIRLSASEDLQMIIQDDLTSLVSLTVIAQGSFEVE